MPKLTVGPSRGVRSAAEFTAWFDERRRAGSFEVTPIPFPATRGWGFDPDTGNLVHESGRFFSVEGVSVRSELGPVTAWSQPIMVQPELGIVGIAVRRTGDGWEALMQAKMEPGNVNTLQLSPTVQATRSNYTRVHAGNSVKYLEYFTGAAPARMLIDVLQSEQGSWFFRKRNRNMVVQVEGDVPADEDFRWVPLDVLNELLHEPNVLNMDSRSVMAHLPLILPDRAPAAAADGDGSRAALARSFTADARTAHPVGELLNWLTSAKARHTVTVERIPLRQVERWYRTDTAISHDEGRYFDVIAVNVEASTREVRGWTQPLLRPGDEVITAAAGFPTTVNPIVHNRLTPVFVDVELGTYNATPEAVEAAIGPRTKAIILAHTLGNPFAAEEIAQIAADRDLWLIEDNCDAVGSTYRGQPTGSFGHMSTASFYPAHHITMGEGGCVVVGNPRLARIVESFRDWGRDCWCEPGENNRCMKRFDYQLGTLSYGYDHKYTFSHVGYNLKSTDLQAALGLSQLEKLPEFGAARRRNWAALRAGLADLEEVLLLPSATPGSDPSWFGFLITIRPDAPFTRREFVSFLEDRQIGTRLLFGGNLTRHPAYQEVEYRIAGDLANSDVITDRTFWIGVYPGITPEMTDYMIQTVHEFVAARTRTRQTA